MDKICLDFTQDATRQYLQKTLAGLLEASSVEQLEESLAQLRDSGIHFHDLGEILAQINAMDIPQAVKQHASDVYLVLAQAEAQVHGCAVEETHFHEVGNAEAVANVLAVCLYLNELGYPRIVATPVQTGSGKVQCAHGLLDIPAPATAAIIERGIPVCSQKRDGEWCTPTSAALIYHFVDEFEQA